MNILGQKIVKVHESVRPGKVTITLMELDGGTVLYGEMRMVRKSRGVCATCGELVPQGCCTCGPRQVLT